MASRFMMEYNGNLGYYWQNKAMKEVERARQEFLDGKAIIDDEGAMFWKSNGNYIPSDVCEKMVVAGIKFSPEKTAEKRDAQTKQFFAEYRKARENHVHSAEELAEMRNAFGEGAVVVDVITGKRIQL